MTNSNAMNKMLSMNCPQDLENGLLGFYFELHCTAVFITAKKIKEYNPFSGFAEYEIVSFKEVDVRSEQE
jgi:hypothetical protein